VSEETWRYFLTVESRPLELTDGEATFGRSRTSTVRLDHESVSRSHALLTLHRGEVTIRDLNSSNGTWIGGKRISGEVRLGDGSRVQLGAAVVELKIVPPAVPSERTALLDSSAGPPVPAVPPSAVPAPAAPPAPITYQPEAAVPEAAQAVDLALPAGPKPITASGLFTDIDRQAREAGVDLPVHEEELPPSADAAATVVPAGPSSAAEVPLAIGPPIAAKAEAREAPEDRRAAPAGPEPRNTAGLAARFAALLVDGVILVAMDLLLFSPLLVIAYFRPALQPALPNLNDPVFSGILGLCIVLAFAANVLYTAGLWAMRGRTPGKALLGLAIVRRGANPGVGIGWNAALLRWLFQILGAVPVGLGWWIALFRKDRRAWHDVVAGTWVVRAR
jgi:uncharacterized RDD family membrane protein YckC